MNDFVLEDSTKDVIRVLAKKAKAIYALTEDEGLTGDWSGDTKQFMALTYGMTENLVEHSRTLVKQSKTLSCWTKVLAGLTISLVCNSPFSFT